MRQGRRIYGIGAAKTGTHTIGEMFAQYVRAAHEVDVERLIRLYFERLKTGKATKLRLYLRLRDLRRRLKVDASQINIYLIDDFEVLFPDCRYVLTVRPPVAWLNSMIDDSLRRDTTETWLQFRDYRFGAPHGHPEKEAVLAERGLYTLDGYLGYWRDAIERPLQRLPESKYLVVPTVEIGDKAEEIARFCGVEGYRGSRRLHSFMNPTKFGILNELDEGYLLEKVERLVGDTARRVFPGWDAQADLNGIRPAA